MFEFNPSWDTVWLTVMLVGIIAWYLWLLKLPLEYSKKEREIELIHKKLEKFYNPLQNALFSIQGAEDHMERYYIKAKATALNSIVKEVNLSSIELIYLIRRFSTSVHYFNYPSYLTMDFGMAYDEIVYLLDKIDASISRDIKEFYLKLDELSH